MSDQPFGLPPIRKSRVKGVVLHRMHYVVDPRGDLSVGEQHREIPFPIRRYFLVFNVPSAETRGAHAHRACHQFLVAARGQVRVTVDDGREREEFLLDHPSLGLYLPPMIWGIQDQYTADAVLLVLASETYEASDYIRNYDEFLKLSSVLHG